MVTIYSPVFTTIRDNFVEVQKKIIGAAAKAGHTIDDVSVVCATKYVADGGMSVLHDAGLRHFGDNRVDALVRHREELDSTNKRFADVTWHYIGQVQSRKANEIAANSDVIHGLSTLSAARKFSNWISASDQNRLGAPSFLVQVNTANDDAKAGLNPKDLKSFLDQLPIEIEVDGFMTMPAWTDNPELSRPAFSGLRELLEEMRATFSGRHPLRHISAGTTQDYLVAIEEGATYVRLGNVLYT